MPQCSALLCRNRGMHRFPKDPEIRKKWENALHIKNFKASKSARLCGAHFRESDYYGTNKYTSTKRPMAKFLKKSVVPSIFLFNEKQSHSKTRESGFTSIKRSYKKQFWDLDFISSDVPISSITAHLKKDAVPSQYLHYPKGTNSKNECRQFKPYMVNEIANKMLENSMEHNISNDQSDVDVTTCKIKVERTSTDSLSTMNNYNKLECRTCLQTFQYETELCDMFQPWQYTWEGMDVTVAADLSKITEMQITSADELSKLICWPCYQRLFDACQFTAMVKRNNEFLRFRCISTGAPQSEEWPKPIQIENGLDSTIMAVEVKQEVLSEPECETDQTINHCPNSSLFGMEYLDIKVEPEEVHEEAHEPLPMKVTVNGSMTIDEFNALATGMVNGGNTSPVCFADSEIKEEPLSDTEDLNIPDIPLECMLCSKVFNKITGLKAHVIAQHSYKTVRRKTDGVVTPIKQNQTKYVCETCRRIFYTPTDLMVHETCHDKFKCFGCNEQFDTFNELGKHRIHCKATPGSVVQKVKTLDDVLRSSISPIPEDNGATVHHFENGISHRSNTEMHSTTNCVRNIFKEQFDTRFS